MSIPSGVQSTHSSNLSMSFLQEVLELQSTILALQQQMNISFSGLQCQISVGVTRINRLMEISSKAGTSHPMQAESTSPTSSGSGSFSEPSEVFMMDKQRTHLRRIPERPTIAMTGRKVDIETPAESRTSMQNSLAVLQSPPHSMFLFQDNDSSRGSILSDRYPYYESMQIMENSQAIYPVNAASKLVAQEPCTLTKSNTTKTARKADRKSGTTPSPSNPTAEPSRTSLGVNVADPESGPAFLSIPEPLLKRAKSANYQPTKLKDDAESQIPMTAKDGSSERIANFKLTQASSIGQWVSKIVLGNQFESGKDAIIDNKMDKSERQEKSDRMEKTDKQDRTETSLQRMQHSKPQSMHSLKLGSVSKYASHSRRSSLMVDAKHVLLQDEDFRLSRSPLVYVSNNDGSAAELSSLSEVHKSLSSSADEDRQSEKRLSVTSREKDISVAHLSNFSYNATTTHARSIRSIRLQILEDPEENASSHKFPTPRVTEVKKRDSSVHQQPTTSDKSHKRSQKPVHKRFAARIFQTPMIPEGEFYGSEPSLGHGKGIFKSGIHAFSLVASTLNLITALATLFAFFFTPYRAAFIDASDTSCATISWSISIFLLFDAAFNLWVTPVLKPTADCRECTTESLRQWQIRYLTRYFTVELIAAIPWIEIVPMRGASFPLSMLLFGKFILLPSKLRNNQILKLAYSKVKQASTLGNPFVGLLKLCFGIILFIHLQACVLYHIASMNGFATWTGQFNRWKLYPGEFDAASAQERYVWILSQSVENVMPLHFISESTVEQICTLCFSVIGALLYASLIALLASTAMCYDVPAKVFRQKLAALEDYLAWRNLDRATSKKLVDYFHFKYQGRYFEEQSVLADMNESLQMELSLMHCKRYIEKVPFMNRNCADGRDDLFMGKIANALVSAFYLPGDVIVHQGERCTEMFFIQSGRVNLMQDGILEDSLSDGNYFGDVALIVNAPSTFTARATAATSIYRLSAADFNSILLEFEDVKKQVDRIYEERNA
ncbi:hypothetical protein HDU77_004798 [Chytriomyces hyalinus]|nr:hypothetical protein HDU77_004798 [Chytriomyces hyalinus]